MVANNILEIYTSMFAWNLYEAIWDVLVGSGMALIPFIAAVILSFNDNYEEGGAEATLRGLEIKIVCMILILVLCVLPFKAWDVTLSTVKYNLNTPDCHLPANTTGAGNSTGTSFDGNIDGMGGLHTHKPVMWTFVELLSSAITHTTIKSMSCVNNYEFMLMRVSNITIQDLSLKNRLNDFYQVCYLKAVQRFKENPVPIPANVAPWDDIDWIGSRILLGAVNEYYSHPEAYVDDMEKYGFHRQPTIRKSDEAKLADAHPYCKEVWLGEGGAVGSPAKGLRQLLLESLPMDDAGDILDDWKTWGADVMTDGSATTQIKEDLILKMILQADSANLKSATAVDLSNDFDTQDQSILAKSADWFFGMAGAYEGVNEFLKMNTIKQMMKQAGPMILAMIQMVIVMSSPFVMTLGKYQLSAFVSVALAYFTFEFINAIWAAAFWFDNQILEIFGDKAGFLDSDTNKFIIMTVSVSSTILLPLVWISIMTYSGAGMVRGMGYGGVGGGQASGGGAFNRVAGNLGAKALKILLGKKK